MPTRPITKRPDRENEEITDHVGKAQAEPGQMDSPSPPAPRSGSKPAARAKRPKRCSTRRTRTANWPSSSASRSRSHPNSLEAATARSIAVRLPENSNPAGDRHIVPRAKPNRHPRPTSHAARALVGIPIFLCRSCSANIPITSAAARPSLTNADIIRIGLSICPKNNLCPAHK